MKKLLTLLLVLPFIFASCSDDDNNTNISSDVLAGTWLFEKTSLDEVKTNNKEATQAIKDDVEEDSDSRTEEYWIFDKDGTVQFQYDENDTVVGKYTLNGNLLKIRLYKSDGSLAEEVSSQISLSSNNTLNFHYDATDFYQDEIDDLLPGNTEDIEIYSVKIVDSYKRIK